MKEQTKKLQDEKAAAANYILTFFVESGTLTDNYAIYINNLVELKAKYGDEPETLKKMSEEEAESMKTTIRNIRYYIIKVTLMYRTISKNLKIEIDADFLLLAKKLRDSTTYDRDELESYILFLNDFLASSIIRELQESSSQVVSNIYGE